LQESVVVGRIFLRLFNYKGVILLTIKEFHSDIKKHEIRENHEHPCHSINTSIQKVVHLEVYSNDLRGYTATHHANAWYIMG
jgi:hypothetical protein